MRKLNSAEMLDLGSDEIAEMRRKVHKRVMMLSSHISKADLVAANLITDGRQNENKKIFATGRMTWQVAGIVRSDGTSFALCVRCSYTNDSASVEYANRDGGWVSSPLKEGGYMKPSSTQDVYGSMPAFVDWLYTIFPDLLHAMRPYLYAAETALAQERIAEIRVS